MDIPSGPTFANFHVSRIKNKVFTEHPTAKPKLYCRFMGYIFVFVENCSQLEILRHLFKRYSNLKFTYKVKPKKRISFLDTMVFIVVVFKTISNAVKVYFHHLEKMAERLIRVEEHLKFNEICLIKRRLVAPIYKLFFLCMIFFSFFFHTESS